MFYVCLMVTTKQKYTVDSHNIKKRENRGYYYRKNLIRYRGKRNSRNTKQPVSNQKHGSTKSLHTKLTLNVNVLNLPIIRPRPVTRILMPTFFFWEFYGFISYVQGFNAF